MKVVSLNLRIRGNLPVSGAQRNQSPAVFCCLSSWHPAALACQKVNVTCLANITWYLPVHVAFYPHPSRAEPTWSLFSFLDSFQIVIPHSGITSFIYLEFWWGPLPLFNIKVIPVISVMGLSVCISYLSFDNSSTILYRPSPASWYLARWQHAQWFQ